MRSRKQGSRLDAAGDVLRRLRWARSRELDHHFWRFNGPRFLEFLPPGRLTIDVGYREG